MSIGYVYTMYFLVHGNGRGFLPTRPMLLQAHDWHHKTLLNYPKLYQAVTMRKLPTNPISYSAFIDFQRRHRQLLVRKTNPSVPSISQTNIQIQTQKAQIYSLGKIVVNGRMELWDNL
jgi:hypothetical protein